MVKYIFLFIVLFMSSCLRPDCKALSDYYRQEECLMVVHNIPNVYDFQIIGKDLKINRDTVYQTDNRWFRKYLETIEKGDTIIKRKGELTFNIHKKDTVMSFNFKCDDKVYK